jgi:hypothetical protein
MHGTLAQCVKRWLDLPTHAMQNCDLSWYDGIARRAVWSARQIGGHVIACGLPPEMASAAGGQPSPEALQLIVYGQPYKCPPGIDPLFMGASTPPRGGG